MNIIDELNLFLFCYNHCIIHDFQLKKKMLETWESVGINFINHKGKLYVSEFYPKSNVFSKNDTETLGKLSQFIKDINTPNKIPLTINDFSEFGIYLKKINGYIYFEKFISYEMITNIYYKYYNSVSLYDKLQIKYKYNNYKKYV